MQNKDNMDEKILKLPPAAQQQTWMGSDPRREETGGRESPKEESNIQEQQLACRRVLIPGPPAD